MRVRVPAIGVDANVVSLGLNSDSTLQVPTNATDAGWWSGGAAPGRRGAAVIVGHVNWGGNDGVFGRLHEILPGQDVLVTHRNGVTDHYRVTTTAVYLEDEIPDRARLRPAPLPWPPPDHLRRQLQPEHGPLRREPDRVRPADIPHRLHDRADALVRRRAVDRASGRDRAPGVERRDLRGGATAQELAGLDDQRQQRGQAEACQPFMAGQRGGEQPLLEARQLGRQHHHREREQRDPRAPSAAAGRGRRPGRAGW